MSVYYVIISDGVIMRSYDNKDFVCCEMNPHGIVRIQPLRKRGLVGVEGSIILAIIVLKSIQVIKVRVHFIVIAITYLCTITNHIISFTNSMVLLNVSKGYYTQCVHMTCPFNIYCKATLFTIICSDQHLLLISHVEETLSNRQRCTYLWRLYGSAHRNENISVIRHVWIPAAPWYILRKAFIVLVTGFPDGYI